LFELDIGLLGGGCHIALLCGKLIFKHPTHAVDLLHLHSIRALLIPLRLTFLLIL
jgi:hypothetical protein